MGQRVNGFKGFGEGPTNDDPNAHVIIEDADELPQTARHAVIIEDEDDVDEAMEEARDAEDGVFTDTDF